MNKIQNPVVLIHKRDNDDSYAVAITSGSQNHHDAVLMITAEPDMTGNADCWSKTGYYMAAEIEQLREKLKLAEEKHLHLLGVVDDYDWQRQRLQYAAQRVISWCRQEAKDRNGNADTAESYSCVRELRAALEFCEKCEGANSIPLNGATTGKPLTINLPDISSKAFWSGTGKSEIFHPETYQHQVKEAIERACAVAGIGVEVK